MRPAIALILTLATACAGAAAPADARTIEIGMRDFSYSTEQITLHAGEHVTIRLTNSGTVEHEFMAGLDPQTARGFADDFFKGVELRTSGGVSGDHEGGHTGIGLRVAPGGTAQMTFRVPDRQGIFEFGCFVPSHYELRMKGALHVEAPLAAPRGSAGPAATGRPAATPTHDSDMDMDPEGH